MSKCKDCKYFGETVKVNGCLLTYNNTTPKFNSCNNLKSIFKVCSENATACEQFELRIESESQKTTGIL